MLRIFFLLAAGTAAAGCGRTPVPATFGEVPRDGRGLPVWSIVAKKASRPDMLPAAYRPDAATTHPRGASGDQS